MCTPPGPPESVCGAVQCPVSGAGRGAAASPSHPTAPSRCSTWVKAGALNPLLPTSFRDEIPVFRSQGCPLASAVLCGFWADKIPTLTEPARPWAKQFIPCNLHNDLIK